MSIREKDNEFNVNSQKKIMEKIVHWKSIHEKDSQSQVLMNQKLIREKQWISKIESEFKQESELKVTS